MPCIILIFTPNDPICTNRIINFFEGALKQQNVQHRMLGFAKPPDLGHARLSRQVAEASAQPASHHHFPDYLQTKNEFEWNCNA